MEYFTLRNTTIMALVQGGVIVTGVLLAGATHKWYTAGGLMPPSSTALLCEYGYLAMILPMVWTVVALLALQRRDDEEAYRWLPLCSGVALLFLLLFGMWQAAVKPLIRLLLWGCEGY